MGKPENRGHSTDVFMLLVVTKRKKEKKEKLVLSTGEMSLELCTAVHST